MKQSKLVTVSVWIIIVTFIFAFIGLLAPSTNYDSNVYHITLPKIYAESGGFVPRHDIMQSRYPQVLSGVNTAVYQFAGEDGIEILNLLASLLILWGITELSIVMKVKPIWQPLAPVILCSCIQFMVCLYDANTENWMAYYLMSMFFCYYLICQYSYCKMLLPLGLFIGVLIGVKATAMPAIMVVFIMTFLHLYKTGGKIISWESITLCIIPIAYNALLFAVVYSSVNGKGDFVGEGVPLFSIERLGYDNLYSSFRTVMLFNLPMIVYILLIPKSLKFDIGIKILMIFLCVLFAIVLTNPFPDSFARYTYYISPIFVIGILLALTSKDSNPTLINNIMVYAVWIMLAICLLISESAHIYRNSVKVPVVLGFEERDAYLSKRVNTYKTIQKTNSLLSNKDKLLMIAERSLWLKVPYILGIERNLSINYNKMTPPLFVKFMEDNQVTYFLYTDEEAEKTTGFLKFWNRYHNLKYNQNFKLVYHDEWIKNGVIRNTFLYKLKK